MALTIDPATKEITIPQSDLTLVTGTLYDLDTDAIRRDIIALLDDEDYIWMIDAIDHNQEYTVAGVTYARKIEVVNGWNLTLSPDSAWTARLIGSNNNMFDVENGILNQNQVQVISQNSAGLIREIANQQDIRDAMQLSATDGAASIDVKIDNTTAIAASKPG